MTKLQLIIPLATATILSACHHQTLDDRADQEVREYTERYCPTPVSGNQRTDSITFTRSNHTFHYFYTLTGVADNDTLIRNHKGELRKALQNELDEGTKNKAYKDAGFIFHYVFRSQKSGKTLLEVTLKGKKSH